MITVQLIKPLQHGANTVTQLEVREPTAKELKVLGFPFTMTTKEIKTDVMFKYMEVLTLQPPPVLDQMGVRDFVNVTGTIMSFFEDSEE